MTSTQPTTPPVNERQKEQLIMMAEDELTQYSTEALKIQRLRRKIGLAIAPAQQKAIKATVEAELPTDPIRKLIETNRQLVALPFWGITGLGLLLGISMYQPLDLLATFFGGIIAFSVQKLGWQLQAKRLLIKTLEEMEECICALRLRPNRMEGMWASPDSSVLWDRWEWQGEAMGDGLESGITWESPRNLVPH